MILTWKIQSTRRETCASATLSSTNPTWTDLGSTLKKSRPCEMRGGQGIYVPHPSPTPSCSFPPMRHHLRLKTTSSKHLARIVIQDSTLRVHFARSQRAVCPALCTKAIKQTRHNGVSRLSCHTSHMFLLHVHQKLISEIGTKKTSQGKERRKKHEKTT
jgi:hypothetical protein